MPKNFTATYNPTKYQQQQKDPFVEKKLKIQAFIET